MTWKPLGWTPEQPGFYFIKSVKPGKIRTTVCEVVSTRYDKDRGFQVNRAGVEDSDWLSYFNKEPWLMYWAGPLPIPADPQP